MQAALIAMTILGCDDGIRDCRYVATEEKHWVSVELCDAESERVLTRYSNVHFPMVVAVCQPDPALSPDAAAGSAVAAAGPDKPQASLPAAEPERQSMGGRALAAIRDVLPDRRDIRMAFEAPLHVITDSYAWAAKKLGKD